MTKFKIGDTVIGNQKADYQYTITKTGWIGTVQEVNPRQRMIRVTGLDASGFSVHSRYFDLLKPFEPKKTAMKEYFERVKPQLL